jgi:hypothetical protein
MSWACSQFVLNAPEEELHHYGEKRKHFSSKSFQSHRIAPLWRDLLRNPLSPSFKLGMPKRKHFIKIFPITSHCTTTERKENIFHQNLSSHIALHHYGEISSGIRATARRRRSSKFPNQEIPQEHFVWTDDWMDDGTDDGSSRFRGCFISHPQNSSKRNQGLLHFSSPKVFIYKKIRNKWTIHCRKETK